MPENANVSQQKSTSPIDIIPVRHPVPTIAVNCDSGSNDEGEQLNWKEEDTNGHEEGVVKRMKGQLRRILKRHSGCDSSTFEGEENPSPTQRYPTAANNVYINGRRYQNYNSHYFFPNDETEMDRLLNNHFLVKQCFGMNYSAPVSEILSIEKVSSTPFCNPPTGTRTPSTTHHVDTRRFTPAQSTTPDITPTSQPPGPSTRPYSNDLTDRRGNPTLSCYIRKITSIGTKSKDRSPTPTATPPPTKMARSASPTMSIKPSPLSTPSTSTETNASTETPVAVEERPTPLGVPATTPSPKTPSSFSPHRRSHHSEGDIRHLQQQDRARASKFYRLDSPLDIFHPTNAQTTRVLDVACGTGVWILEMAHEFPHAQFYGFDLSEIFPTAIRPNNTFFCLYDMNQGLPYPDCFFDFIHMKDVFACFPAAATKFIMQELRRCLKPGGYIELKELDFCIFDPGPITAKFTAADSLTASGLMHRFGVDIIWPRMIRKHLNTMKMADVHSRMIPLTYTSRSDSSIDKMFYRFLNDRLDACRRLFSEIHGQDQDSLDHDIRRIKDEMLERASYCCYYMAWGRKPLVDDDCYYNKLSNSNRSSSLNRVGQKGTSPAVSPSSNSSSIDVSSDSYGYEIFDFTDGFTD